MTAAERQKAIEAYVLDRGDARIDELVDTFGVSRMTIHRHIEELSRLGVIRKLHGSVSAQPSGVYESLFSFRQNRETDVKRALAAEALGEISPGEVILLDDSTTVSTLGPMLAAKTPLNVVTNSLGLATDLVAVDEITLLSLGGDYHPTYNAFIGHLCENALAGLKVNTLICSTSAVENGLALIQDPAVTRVKQAMMQAAKRTILLVDSGKYGKVALHAFAPLSEFDLVITDDGLDDATITALRAAGVNLRLVARP
ncbi:MAG: DeoR/GlpR family DNA-binding transcription regulator, partial [Pseudomonadota bacterium]